MAVLLLNASFQPLNVISSRRLVVLLSKERVQFLDSEMAELAKDAMRERQLPDGVMVVRLMRNIHIPRRMLRPNRRNLLLRDDNTCQYCGHSGAASDLTIDHVVPMSRGGASSSWTNQVVACKRCNWRKANHLPSEVGLRLRREPKALTQEYAHILFLRYPELREAYQRAVA